MDTRENRISARSGMLALADEVKNISHTCQVAGISRTQFYDIKAASEKYGRDALAPTERRRPRMPNETPAEVVGPTMAASTVGERSTIRLSSTAPCSSSTIAPRVSGTSAKYSATAWSLALQCCTPSNPKSHTNSSRGI
jgi:Winged helix-turn helix